MAAVHFTGKRLEIDRAGVGGAAKDQDAAVTVLYKRFQRV
jgi:hypothetical protein